jgi:hypothetical protein
LHNAPTAQPLGAFCFPGHFRDREGLLSSWQLKSFTIMIGRGEITGLGLV